MKLHLHSMTSKNGKVKKKKVLVVLLTTLVSNLKNTVHAVKELKFYCSHIYNYTQYNVQ